jgi:hypothetical protein
MAQAIAISSSPFHPFVLLVLLLIALAPRCVALGEDVSIAASEVPLSPVGEWFVMAGPDAAPFLASNNGK